MSLGHQMMCAAIMIVCGFVSATPALGMVVYDNGGVNTSTNPTFSAGSFQTADDFVLTSGSNTFNQVNWWGIYPPGSIPANDVFGLQILGDNNGAPDPNNVQGFFSGITHTRVDTGDTLLGQTLFAFEATIPAVTLPANTPFWLSLFGSTANDFQWAKSVSFTGERFHLRNAANGLWFPSGTDQDLAFNLSFVDTSGVPEPITAMLILLGLAALGYTTKRRRMAQVNI